MLNISAAQSPENISQYIIEATRSMICAQKVTVWIADWSSRTLQIKFSLESAIVGMRIPITKGLAGECAISGKLINIPDAYLDERFDQKVDRETGFRTKSVLVVPVFNADGTEVEGVIQALNKTMGENVVEFMADDIELMQYMSRHAGMMLERSMHLSKLKLAEDTANCMLSIVKSAIDTNVQLDVMSMHICKAAGGLVDGEKVSLYLVDQSNRELWMTHAHNFVKSAEILKFGEGIIGSLAVRGVSEIINDIDTDGRLQQEVFETFGEGVKAKCMLCVPVLRPSGKPMAIIQVLNKSSGSIFTALDRKTLEDMSVDVAHVLRLRWSEIMYKKLVRDSSHLRKGDSSKTLNYMSMQMEHSVHVDLSIQHQQKGRGQSKGGAEGSERTVAFRKQNNGAGERVASVVSPGSSKTRNANSIDPKLYKLFHSWEVNMFSICAEDKCGYVCQMLEVSDSC